MTGDAKTDVSPIFNLVVVLEKNHRVDVRPSVQALFDMIHSASKDLITVVSVVPRLCEVGCTPRKTVVLADASKRACEA